MSIGNSNSAQSRENRFAQSCGNSLDNEIIPLVNFTAVESGATGYKIKFV